MKLPALSELLFVVCTSVCDTAANLSLCREPAWECKLHCSSENANNLCDMILFTIHGIVIPAFIIFCSVNFTVLGKLVDLMKEMNVQRLARTHKKLQKKKISYQPSYVLGFWSTNHISASFLIDYVKKKYFIQEFGINPWQLFFPSCLNDDTTK